jgi:hypothetical protein
LISIPGSLRATRDGVARRDDCDRRGDGAERGMPEHDLKKGRHRGEFPAITSPHTIAASVTIDD